jgi:hypothetical protein
MQISLNTRGAGWAGGMKGPHRSSENGSKLGKKTLGYTSKTVTKKNANETSRKTNNGRISNEEKKKKNSDEK